MSSRILILGGSTEGFALAEALAKTHAFEPVTSFAGRTKTRRSVAGASRAGGFGGPEGLREYLLSENISALIDATHPFAQIIKKNAQSAAGQAKIPVLHILRSAWAQQSGDDWREVETMTAAAAAIPQGANPTFLTVGRTELAPFVSRRDISFLARVIDAPENTGEFAKLDLVFARGPFDYKSDMALFRKHKIACLVSKNSGGDAAGAKLVVARELGVPVIMINRPKLPAGEIAGSVKDAITWLENKFS